MSPVAATLPWQLAPDLPWHVLTSPLERWADQPTFVLGEYTFIVLALLALWHARRSGRAHVLAWLAAIVAGTSNDVIFMALPLVDNFWQAQATVMLTPRLPLYIPCVYVTFMYLPTVAVWRLRMPLIPAGMLAGLVAILFYAPYDIVGAKFLWWTWHDTDLPIATRLFGVPVGSTLWVITFVATFYWLLTRILDGDPQVSTTTSAKGLLAVAALTSLLMVLQMTALQQLDGGAPGLRALAAASATYAAVAAWGLRAARPREAPSSHDRVLLAGIAAYFAILIFLIAAFDPATHRSTSLHQTVGECHVEATDITGAVRYEFLCLDDFDEDFSFDCLPTPPRDGEQWYTVCGRAHTDRAAWIAAVAGLGALGLAAFWILLAWVRPRRPDPSAPLDRSRR